MKKGGKKGLFVFFAILKIAFLVVMLLLILDVRNQKIAQKKLSNEIQILRKEKADLESIIANNSTNTSNNKQMEEIGKKEDIYAINIIDDILYLKEKGTNVELDQNLLNDTYKYYIALYATLNDENLNNGIESGIDTSKLPEGVYVASGVAFFKLDTLNKYYNEIFGTSVTEEDLLQLNSDKITKVENGIVYGTASTGQILAERKDKKIQETSDKKTYSITENILYNKDKEYNVKLDYTNKEGKYILTSLVLVGNGSTAEVAVNTAEKTVKVDTSENLNEATIEIIKKLTLEKMPAFKFKQEGKYNIVGKYIDNIELFSEHYYAVQNGKDESVERRVDWYNRETQYKEDIKAEVVAIGNITFTTEFDKEIEQDDVVFAGGSKSIMLYKNYVVQHFIFELDKLENGEYVLSLNTGM